MCLQSCAALQRGTGAQQCSASAEFSALSHCRAADALRGTAVPDLMSAMHAGNGRTSASVAASVWHLACAACCHACFTVAAVWSCHRPVGQPFRSLQRRWARSRDSLTSAWSRRPWAVHWTAPRGAYAARAERMRERQTAETRHMRWSAASLGLGSIGGRAPLPRALLSPARASRPVSRPDSPAPLRSDPSH